MAGVRAVWLEPGAFDDGCISYARQKFEVAVGGSESIWSILDKGEDAMRRARAGVWVNEWTRREEREERKEIGRRRKRHELGVQEAQSAGQSDGSPRMPRYSSL